MTQRKTAGFLFICSALLAFIGQAIAIAQWDGMYQLSANLISDLGVTECVLSDDQFISRFICSPGHLWFNLGLGASAVLLAAAGFLLIGAQRQGQARSGTRTGAIAIAQAIAIVVIAAVPFNVQPTVHDIAAILSMVLGIALMVSAALASREVLFNDNQRTMLSSAARGLTWVLLVIVVIGFVALLFVTNRPGLWERMAVDVQTVWTLLLGVSLLNTKDNRKPSPEGAQAELDKRNAVIVAAKAQQENNG